MGGSYYGSVIVTSPVTVAVHVLNFDLVNVGGTLTGTLNSAEAALYEGDIGLHGITDGDTFTVTSDVISNTVLGWSVQRTFTLAGQVVKGGDLLKATYTGVITNWLCDPVIEHGGYTAARPTTPGSQILSVEAAESSWLAMPTAFEMRMGPPVDAIELSVSNRATRAIWRACGRK